VILVIWGFGVVIPSPKIDELISELQEILSVSCIMMNITHDSFLVVRRKTAY
jgi:hypothetical protein